MQHNHKSRTFDWTEREVMETGCIAYLKKPFVPRLLLDAIAKPA